MPTIESLLERLIQYQVEFVVVGDFAEFAHGVTIATQKFETCCPFTPENLTRTQAGPDRNTGPA